MYLKQLTAVTLLSAAVAACADETVSLEFIGEVTFATGYSVLDTEVGGLSGLDYDRAHNSFVAISDDRAQINMARFYDLSIDLSDGYLDEGDIQFTGVTEILDSNEQPFAEAGVDPESIRVKGFPDLLCWTSEGDANNGVAPFVRVMSRTGHFVDEFELSDKYLPTETQGIRNNLAFESLTFSVDGKTVYTATENALLQDGEAASLETGSYSRVLKLSNKTGAELAEYIYATDPVIDAPIPAGEFSTNGLVELLAVAPNTFIALERAFSTGVGNSIRLYLTTTRGATDVIGAESIADVKRLRVMPKILLKDLASLGITLDNIEGITMGPDLPDGSKSLILVSDNNFSSGQFTQFLAFKVSGLGR